MRIYIKIKEVERCGDCPNISHPNGFYRCQETGSDVDITSIDVDCPLPHKNMATTKDLDSLVFSAKHWIHVAGKGWTAVVENNVMREDFEDLMYAEVLIDGENHRVSRVETFFNQGPYPVGELIGLGVKGSPSKEIQEKVLRG